MPRLKFARLNVPLLLVSDAPELLTGLARFGRDLASLIARDLPQFRVGYLGRGGTGRRTFPWMQYGYPEIAQWGEVYIEDVWRDFAGDENGVIMSLWDLSRMHWFAQPGTLPTGRLRTFLGPGRTFEKWAYVPVDGTGPDEQSLGAEMTSALAGYDRVCAASEWGAAVMTSSGRPDADWIPHGIWTEKFRPTMHGYNGSKNTAGWVAENLIYVGCVMTNQARKDWPVAFEAIAILRHEYGNRLRFWIHTDKMIHYWNLYALADDFGVADILDVTLQLTDEQLALRYSACDCTILPSGGEGFGYPIAESMACGTACVATGYAAGSELIPEPMRVRPMGVRIDTSHNVSRAILSGHGFARLAKEQIERKRADWSFVSEENRQHVMHLEWSGNFKEVWKKWLLRGLNG